MQPSLSTGQGPDPSGQSPDHLRIFAELNDRGLWNVAASLCGTGADRERVTLGTCETYEDARQLIEWIFRSGLSGA